MSDPFGMCAYPGHQPAPIWRPPVGTITQEEAERIKARWLAAKDQAPIWLDKPKPRRRLYAWRTNRPPTPERAAAGCPSTGWIHEGRPPWRVIVANHPDTLWPIGIGYVAEYTGDEKTVPFSEWLDPQRPRRPWWKRLIRVRSTQRKAGTDG